MTDKITSADGVEGFLIWVAGDKYVFRVYSEDKTFKDYDIRHSDMCVTVRDADATLYEYKDGSCYLDHSPETLGVRNEKC